ncbi:uncharacterized protein LOC123678670 [Harmonia axyridis]|uniref:uncharacterized protein LOC123678670 n=1 Tax=Harmonia axyridis TaxID=115357 RepID=UPI001E27637D|nr:uncharacterized protein LOC123678670 [Harmonia axyridis]
MQNDTANFAAAHSLECFYQNVRGLRSKTHDIFDSIVQSEYDIICLSETWLSSDILDSEICDDRYVLYRNDRNFDLTSKSRGGGVLIAVRSSLMACSINLDSIKESFPNVNIMGLRIGLRGSHFYILTLYIPPNTASDQYEDVLEAISVLPCLLDENANLIIVGDFNIPDYVTHRETTLHNVRVEVIENFLNFFGLTQSNEDLNANQRLLDLVCSKCPIVVRESLFPLVSIDAHHPPLEFSVASSGKPNKFQKVSFEGYNFRRANLSRLYDMLLTTNWDFLEEFGDINLACDAFYNVLQRVFSECVPRLSERKTSYPPWFTGDIIGRLKVKNKYLRKYKSTGDSQFLDMFRDLRKNLRTEIAGARTDFIHRAEADLSGNPSKFWGYLNTMRGNSSVPGSMNYQNHQLSAPQDIVNAFASFFNSAFIVSSNYQHEESSDISFTQSLAIPEITEDDVLRSLKKCKANMTSGPDGIPSFLLKDCAIILARPLTLIFRLSLSVQCFPIIWREGRVSPVFIKDDKNKVENYRPIVILSNFSKVFERLLYDIVYGHVKCRISDFQHGFIKGRSTITNLTCITQYITSALDDSSQVDVIYTDFSKAFDRLDHDGTSVQASSTMKITSMSPDISAGTVRGSTAEPTTVIAAPRIVDSSAISKNPQPVNRNDEGTWKSVSKAKNKWTVTGSATGMTVKASQKKISLFVSRIHPQTSLKDFTEMVSMNFKAQCECLKSKHPENYLSFKVIINECDLDKAKVVTNWPEGTLVMKFFQRSGKRIEPS